MISGGDDKKAILWDLKQLKQIKVLEDDKKSDLVLDHQSRIISVSLSQDIKWGLTADSNSKVILWNLKYIFYSYLFLFIFIYIYLFEIELVFLRYYAH